MKKIIKKLSYTYIHIQKKTKWNIYQLLVLILLSALLEVVTIGAVLPFLALLFTPDSFSKILEKNSNITKINIINENNYLQVITFIFILLIVVACIVRLLVLWLSSKISFKIGLDIGSLMYENILYRDYSFHISKNSSEVIGLLAHKTDILIYYVIQPLFVLISSALIFTSIIAILLYLNPIGMLVIFILFSAIYLLSIKLTHKKLQTNGNIVNKITNEIIKSIQEGIGGIRDIILDNTQGYYRDNYYKKAKLLRETQSNSLFLSSCPRNIIEAFALFLIVISCYLMFLFDSENINRYIPIIGVIVLGAQRGLPVLQQVFWAWANIHGHLNLLDEVNKNLSHESHYKINKNKNKLSFEKSITLKNISFRYNNNSKWILKDFNLKINKGEIIGVVGETGRGKSTLADIILGLLNPSSGLMLVDDNIVSNSNIKEYQSIIAHVPQDIFLMDGSIIENIAIGIPKNEIDHHRVIDCSMKANLKSVIEAFENGYESNVGERGIGLSGGQKQRIAIARALYKGAQILVFDEATSALDAETEKNVMESIYSIGENITIIIIAHRISSLNGCTKVIEL